MSTSGAGFDVGPLSWVKGEIDLAMRRGVEALRAFEGNQADGATIKSARAHLHQAHGALRIVGLDGVTRVSDELENLLAGLEKQPAMRSESNFALAARASDAIVAYLDALVAGSPERPVALFPLYESLVAALGKPAAEPVELYFPDLGRRPPSREHPPVALAREDEAAYYREQRGRYQRGLLKWLKGAPGGAQEMRDAVEAIEAAQAATSQRAFWWVALAFFDALVADALSRDADAKRLCNRIEQQIRRRAEGSPNVAERLMREALYYVARARPATEHLEAVRSLYGLEETLPRAEAAVPPAQLPALKPAREALGQAKNAWNRFASGAASSLGPFRSAVGALRNRSGELGNAELGALAREIAAVADRLSSGAAKMSDAIALETATALLLLENALADPGTLGEEFARQSRFVRERLNACVEGKLLRTAPPIPLLDEMSRRAQERLVTNQVVAEMQANLREIERALDGFFRDPDSRTGLAALPVPLRQVKGALAMLGEARARDSLAQCEAEIERFARPEYEPLQDDFEAIAQTLSGLGFYIEALAGGKADFDEAMRPIPARREPPRELVATVEMRLREQKREAQDLIREWKKKPTETWLRAELQKSLAEMRKDANLVSDATLEHQAQQALRVLETTGEAPLEPQVAQALEDIVPEVQVPDASAESEKLAEASEEIIDAELLAVYLEEAEEVLAGIRDHLEILRVLATDRLALTTIRRGFHTLKGSGRMVGLTRLGEAAWSVEKTLNLWLQEERGATPDLMSLISVAEAYFADNVERLKSGGSASDETALVELAAQVARGERLEAETAPPELEGEAAAPEAAPEEAPAEAPSAAAMQELALPPEPPAAAAEEVPELSERQAPGEVAEPPPLPAPEIPEPTAEEASGEAAEQPPEIVIEEAALETADAAHRAEPPADEAVPPEAPSGEAEQAPLPEIEPAAVPGTPQFEPEELPAAAADAALVRLGGEEVSAAVFESFVRESRAHLDTMMREREVLAQQAVITDALMRAAHTLAGISATLRVWAARELASALEQALQTLSALPASESEEALVGEAIDALGLMVADIVERRQPAARLDLVERLRRCGAPVEPEPLGAEPLPEEEAAVPRREEQPAAALEQAAAPEAPPLEEPAPQEPAEEFAREPTLPETAELAAPALEAEAARATRGAAMPTPVAERRQQRMADEFDAQLLPLFLEEAQDLVPAIGRTLREWRVRPADASQGQALQRMLHTLKGSARMAGAMALGELTHHMETRVENALPLGAVSGALLDDLEASYDRLGLLYDRAQQSLAAAAGAAAAVSQPETTPQAVQPAGEVAPPAPQEFALPRAMLRVQAHAVDRLVNQAGEVSIARSRIEGEMRALRQSVQDLTDNVARLRSQLREIEIQAESQMQSRMKEAQAAEQQFDPLEFDRFTRFQELTRLMAESVGDVQTVHQGLIQAVDRTEAGLRAQARLNRDLQQDLMRMRMVPFGSLAERLYRIVRQTAKEIGKRASLDIRGAQVELDRSVLERMTAPFEHLLRNAVTHGIEAPAQRKAKGKPEIGEIRLSITQEGNDLLLSFSDDGAGLAIDAIRARAAEMRLAEDLAALSDAEVADFIFLPGFTTSAALTEIAGRGVGMDVVRTEIDALGGRIELESHRDEGTRFSIYLPLTLAVTQAVLVKSGERAFAIPAVMVEQVRQFKADEIASAYGAGRAEWQSRRYPFHYLPQLLGERDARAASRRLFPVLFLRSGAGTVAVHVDDILGGAQEIVVKAVGAQLQGVKGITGATVLGSGEIALILNPVQLALREAAAAAAPAAPPLETARASERPTVMVVDDSLTVRKITGRLLAREGYEVLVAKDGVEAIERLQEIVPDAMLVDIEMPRMNGFDLTRNLRADPRLSGVPVIVITSRSAEKHQDYARQIGVDAFLGKPYQEEELLAQLARLIEVGHAG